MGLVSWSKKLEVASTQFTVSGREGDRVAKMVDRCLNRAGGDKVNRMQPLESGSAIERQQ